MRDAVSIDRPVPTPAVTHARRRYGATVVKRLTVAAAGFGVFVFVASLVDPQSSPAGQTDMAVNVPHLTEAQRQLVEQRLLARRHPRHWPVLGLLEGPEYYTLIHSSPDGPRYTVCALNGQVLLADLPADDVYRAFPTLDVSGMRLDPPDLPPGGEAQRQESEALMLADPGSQFPN